MPVAGNVIRDEWYFIDVNENPLTGMQLNVDVTLALRRDAGAGFGVASETVSWLEEGGGYYQISFTPTLSGLYRLYLKETKVGSLQRLWTFVYEVTSAGSVSLPSFSNAFCSETDVEAWAGMSFDGLSKPTSDQVAGFAQGRASEMRSLLAAEGWTVAPTTVTPGSTDEDILRACNAVGAAGDAWLSKLRDTEPAKSEAATTLLEEYQTRLSRLVDYAAKVVGGIGIGSPMEDGEVTLKDEMSITDAGLSTAIRMDQEF